MMTRLIGSAIMTTAVSGIVGASHHQVGDPGGRIRCDTIVVASDSGNGRLGHGAFSPSGRMAWSEGGTKAVFVRRNGGTLTIGRAGEGPGEFRDITAYGWQAETLWVADRVTARVTWFTPGGMVLRTRRTPHTGDWHLAPNGTLIERQSDAGRPRVVAGWLSESGDTLTSLRATGDPWFVVPAGRGTFFTGVRPFHPRVVTAASPDRRRWCVAVSDAVGRTITLRCVDGTGRSLRRAELEVEAQPLSAAEFAAARSKIGRGADVGVRNAIDKALLRPANHPAVTHLLVSNDGMIWLRRTGNEAFAERWLPIGVNGKPAQEVTLPTGYRAAALYGREYLAIAPDRDGIESMLRCPLPAGT